MGADPVPMLWGIEWYWYVIAFIGFCVMGNMKG